MLTELRRIAVRENREMLAYLIEMAALEAAREDTGDRRAQTDETR